MPQLTIRTEFDLQQLSREQSISTEKRDTARQRASEAVHGMFPHGSPSEEVARQLTDALARIESCREEDTDSQGRQRPRPMTLTTMQSGEVHESVEHLPQRYGAFDMSPEGRTDEYGRPLNKFNKERGIWEPLDYGDRS